MLPVTQPLRSKYVRPRGEPLHTTYPYFVQITHVPQLGLLIKIIKSQLGYDTAFCQLCTVITTINVKQYSGLHGSSSTPSGRNHSAAKLLEVSRLLQSHGAVEHQSAWSAIWVYREIP